MGSPGIGIPGPKGPPGPPGPVTYYGVNKGPFGETLEDETTMIITKVRMIVLFISTKFKTRQ